MTARLLLASLLAVASAAAAASGTRYTLDPRHTNVLASWSHFGYSHPSAHFGEASGTLVYDAEAPERSTVEVTLPLSAMTTFVPKLDEHLRSPDFFDAAQFPSATFRSTAVQPQADGTLRVTGELTLKGVTRPVVLLATLNKADAAKIGFDATGTIKRSEFGIARMLPAVGDEITLRITTEAAVPRDTQARP